MSIYTKARAKITIGTVVVSLAIVIGAWLLLFVTDYVMYKNNMPMLFSKTKVEEIDGKHYSVESGLGYYVITDTNNESELFIFGKKIK